MFGETSKFIVYSNNKTKILNTKINRTYSPNNNNIYEKASPIATLIISHCNESLSWIDKYYNAPLFNWPLQIVIYEKCGNLMDIRDIRKNADISQILLSIVGREGHSWLYHILVNTELITPINIFHQAKPHNPYLGIHGTLKLLRALKHNDENNHLSHLTKLVCPISKEFYGNETVNIRKILEFYVRQYTTYEFVWRYLID